MRVIWIRNIFGCCSLSGLSSFGQLFSTVLQKSSRHSHKLYHHSKSKTSDTSQNLQKNTSMEVMWFAPGVVQTSTKVNITRQVQNRTQIRAFLEDGFDQIPSWCLILDQEQIYRPNMNRIEHHFHGKSAVHRKMFWMPVVLRINWYPVQITKKHLTEENG